jgi:hypothetical protein
MRKALWDRITHKADARREAVEALSRDAQIRAVYEQECRRRGSARTGSVRLVR